MQNTAVQRWRREAGRKGECCLSASLYALLSKRSEAEKTIGDNYLFFCFVPCALTSKLRCKTPEMVGKEDQKERSVALFPINDWRAFHLRVYASVFFSPFLPFLCSNPLFFYSCLVFFLSPFFLVRGLHCSPKEAFAILLPLRGSPRGEGAVGELSKPRCVLQRTTFFFFSISLLKVTT